MKIISKYKDFYDFIVQDHDADLTYIRQIGIVTENFDHLFNKEGNYYSKYWYSNRFSYKKGIGELEFDNFIFGIYPFVYSQPILRIYYKDRSYGGVEDIFIILGRELVDNLLSDIKELNKQAYDKLIKLAQTEYNILVDRGKCKDLNVSFGKRNIEDIKDALKHYVWKIDCPDIFYKIESPVFTKYYDELYVDGAYYNNWPQEPRVGHKDITHYVTNISFQKLNYNILKYWYNDVFDLNIYINIENFLWSIKQEPEAKPDNKTKILAHGFDLKTSFRKM